MARHLIAQAVLPKVTQIGEDSVVNTFAFYDNQATADGPEEIADGVAAFYNTPDGVFSATALAAYLAPRLSRAVDACEVRIYDVSANLGAERVIDGGVPAGSPIYVGTFTLGAAVGATSVPEEVALCLTLRDKLPSGALYPPEGAGNVRPRKRHSGRIYTGPFGSNALGLIDSDARPIVGLQSAVLGAGNSLYTATTLTSPNAEWSIWSRADEAFHPVEQMEVDNAWDTIRSRGIDPSTRNVASLPYP